MVEIVEVRAPMVVKKDTLEFNAGYYKPRENAVMEELLKKLPGVEIAADGTIKVNGETVKNILVDGKPFFGDDPKLATRNLPADMIDKVQLIDRKSDQAQFMGMEDAQRDKEINVILKEKNDQFLGSMAAGAGTEGRFAGNLSINRFGEGEQVSFLGGANNVNNTGFLQGTGQGIGVNGITRSWNGGVNYNKDLSDELKVSASYMTNSNRTENEQTSTRQNLLPDTTYYYNQQSVRVTSQTNHIIDMRTEYRPDTLHYLMVTGSLNFMSTDNLQQDIYESSDGEHRLVNSGQLFNNNTAKAPNAGASIFFGKQFKKKGRKLGANFYFMNNVNRQEGYNRSNNLFIEPVGEPGRDTVNQLNEQDSRHRLVQLSVTYSEPLFKNYFLDFFYAQIRNYTTTGKLTRDFNEAKRAYDQLNDSL
ncbi:MAG TPA: hypothetical protein VFS25_13955, partial [Chitinophaga sp.]|uniref:hypothetical protein n=1 Tax=Chitinophaga sp. TaxID=1869181 RepID=UPI002DB72A8C